LPTTVDHKVVDGCCKVQGKDRYFAEWLIPVMKTYFEKAGNLNQICFRL
jgi:hypothetical protein